MTGPIQQSSYQASSAKQDTDKSAALRLAAQELEATFLYEMLKSAGVGEARSEFGGGVGEDQFSSLLLQQQADLIVKNGGLGLAEGIFTNLLEQGE